MIIQQAIWLYARFTLSFRDVEDLLAERGIMVSYETVRRWVNHFGSAIAADLRKRRPKPHSTWHLDEVYIKIDGRLVYLWRAVDAEGEVLVDVLYCRAEQMQSKVVLKLSWKLLKKMNLCCDKLLTDGRAALRVSGWGARWRGAEVVEHAVLAAGAAGDAHPPAVEDQAQAEPAPLGGRDHGVELVLDLHRVGLGR